MPIYFQGLDAGSFPLRLCAFAVKKIRSLDPARLDNNLLTEYWIGPEKWNYLEGLDDECDTANL